MSNYSLTAWVLKFVGYWERGFYRLVGKRLGTCGCVVMLSTGYFLDGLGFESGFLGLACLYDFSKLGFEAPLSVLEIYATYYVNKY